MWRHARLTLLAAMQGGAQAAPNLCRHQLATIAREIERARTVADAPTYFATNPDFALVRSALLDEAVARADTGRLLDHPWQAAAAQAQFVALAEVTSEAQWQAVVPATTAAVDALARQGTDTYNAAERLLHAVVRARQTVDAPERGDLRELARLANADPHFGADLPAPRHRNAMPWLARLSCLTRDLIDAGVRPKGEPWQAPPSGGWPKPMPLRDDVASSATQSPTDDLEYAEALGAAACEPTLLHSLAADMARGQHWYEPLVVEHAQHLRDTLAPLRNSSLVQMVYFHADACFSIEAAWNNVFTSALGVPLVLALEPERSRSTAAEALARTYELTGGAPTDFTRMRARLAHVWERPALTFAARGEAGHELMHAGNDLAGPERQARLRGLLPSAPGAEPPVHAWGQPVAPHTSLISLRPRLVW